MRIAADILRRLLPESAPQLEGWSLVGSNRPCRTIGGDYFDFAVENGRLLLALGDVSGKGTGAALLMTVLRAAVRAHWAHEDLAVAVARINRTVYQNIPLGKYITFFVARLDPATGALAYVNAGHNPPFLQRRDGSLETLRDGGVVLGLFETAAYQRGAARLEPGVTLVVFSDGVTETWNPDDEEFGEEGLGRVLAGSLGQDASVTTCRIHPDGCGTSPPPSPGRTRSILAVSG